jgi:hypothetical protein
MTDAYDPITYTVHPSRLAWGTWDQVRGHEIDAGDIHSAYSADIIASEGRVRDPFIFDGGLWVTVTISGCGDTERAEAYRLVPLRLFPRPSLTYRDKIGTEDGAETAKADPLGFYNGIAVRHGREPYVLLGPPAIFVPGEEPQRDDKLSAPKPPQLDLF